MNTAEIGKWLGLIIGVAGGIGIALGGFLADRFGRRDVRWYLWLVSVALIVSLPFSFGAFLAPTSTEALWFLVVPVLLGNFYQGTTFAQTQGLVGLRMRAIAAGVLLFIVNIIGLGAGPTVVGHRCRPAVAALRHGIAALCAAGLLGGEHLGGRSLLLRRQTI